MKSGPYRDGAVHVLAARCSTCVFGAGNPMHLQPGRFRDLVESNRRRDTALTCHQTLPYSGTGAKPAICRGYFDAYATQITPLRIAVAVNMITYDEPPRKEED